MSKITENTILQNKKGQYTKVIDVTDGRYAITGWSASEEKARESNVRQRSLNRYGLESMGAVPLSTDDPVEQEDEAEYTRTDLRAKSADEIRELADEHGLDSEANKKDLLPKLFDKLGI